MIPKGPNWCSKMAPKWAQTGAFAALRITLEPSCGPLGARMAQCRPFLIQCSCHWTPCGTQFHLKIRVLFLFCEGKLKVYSNGIRRPKMMPLCANFNIQDAPNDRGPLSSALSPLGASMAQEETFLGPKVSPSGLKVTLVLGMCLVPGCLNRNPM